MPKGHPILKRCEVRKQGHSQGEFPCCPLAKIHPQKNDTSLKEKKGGGDKKRKENNGKRDGKSKKSNINV